MNSRMIKQLASRRCSQAGRSGLVSRKERVVGPGVLSGTDQPSAGDGGGRKAGLIGTKIVWLVVAIAVCTIGSEVDVYAQGNGGGGGGGNNQGGGILINPEGLVKPQFVKKRSHQLIQKQRAVAAAERLPADLNQASESRKVSLVALEAAYAEHVAAGTPIPDELFYLAGLQRIDNVFVLPDQSDMVITGPAEGFAADELGRVLGVESGRPPLRLDDLVIALRAVRNRESIRCSIDPDRDRLAKLQDYINNNRTATTARVAQQRYRRMADILGPQDVSVSGVPETSHFALALVEADVRMKLLTIGLERVSVKGFRSHLDTLGRGANTMQRWWIVPLYDALLVSEDGLAFELGGQRGQLMGENEIVDATGLRTPAPTTRASISSYAQQFTKQFPELVKEVPAFAQLQNVIDLAILAELIRAEGLDEKAGWEAKTFGDPESDRFPKYAPAKQVSSAFNTKRSGRSMVIGLIAGGVIVRPSQVVSGLPRTTAGAGLAKLRTQIAAEERPSAHRWWWD